jgi:hypothetical protein
VTSLAVDLLDDAVDPVIRILPPVYEPIAEQELERGV